jgi:Trk-type K+ transport system membrane component
MIALITLAALALQATALPVFEHAPTTLNITTSNTTSPIHILPYPYPHAPILPGHLFNSTSPSNTTTTYPHNHAERNFHSAAWYSYIGFLAFGVIVLAVAVLVPVACCGIKRWKGKKAAKVEVELQRMRGLGDVPVQVPEAARLGRR